MNYRADSSCRQLFILVSLIVFVLVPVTGVSAIEYKDYKAQKATTDYFVFERNKEVVSVTGIDADRTLSTVVESDDIQVGENGVMISKDTRFETDALVIQDSRFPYNAIHSSQIFGLDDKIEIRFTRKEGEISPASKTRQGNIITYSGKTVVEKDQFVRGTVLNITGDIEIFGEINQDVISLFGDVFIASGAVVRGDIACPNGRVNLARDASIYGEVFSYDQREHGSRKRIKKYDKALSIDLAFKYNRVDGATPLFTGKYKDSDSLLPTLWATGGYGFASDRWRYEFGVEQTLWRDQGLGIGGKFFRRLASDDDWLLNDDENIIFALLVTEDFKDYYEAEGGSIYLNYHPWEKLSFSLGYTQEETNWLKATPHLWSMFGGDKLFGDNFGRVPFSYRTPASQEIDSTTNGFISANLEFDTKYDEKPYRQSSWKAAVAFEYASESLQSDFDYRRYRFQLTRYQRVTQRTMLMVSGVAGLSDGYLPMYKRYYLGGLGTLRGYYHKEFMGSRFWMTTAEYKVQIPKSDLAVSIFWDGGQIANDTRLTGDIEVKQDIGFALYLDDDFKINISKRLDGAPNGDPKIYVRFSNVF